MRADVAGGGGGISPSLMAARKYLGYAALGALTATAGKLAFSAAKAAVRYVQQFGLRGALRNVINGGLGLAKRAWERVRKQNAAGRCGCFVASTIVWTASGMVPIEHVRVGDLVVARDESTGQIELRPVDALIVTEGAALLDVAVVHPGCRVETIRTTDEHPFWVECPAPGPGEIQRPAEPMAVRDPNAPAAWRSSEFSGWRRADGLRAGDELRTISGPATVVGLAFTAERQRVHNLTVRGLATYHVGPDGVVVHNCTAARMLKESGGQLVRNHSPEEVAHLIDDLIENGWKLTGALSGKAGAFRVADGKGSQLRFDPGGTRIDPDHFNDAPYWAWSDGANTIKYPARIDGAPYR